MKKWIKKHSILLLLMLIGIGAAVGVLATRVSVENANKTYDIVMDYSALEDMVKASDEDMDFWLDYFRELGIEKLAIQEETVNSLVVEYKGILRAQTPGAIYNTYGWEQYYPEEVQNAILNSEYTDDVLVTCQDPELFAWILDAFSSRCDVELQVFYAENGDGFLFLAGDGKDINGSKLIELPLGVDPKKKAQADQYGYALIPRTIVVEGLNGETFAEAVLEDYAEVGTPYIIGVGLGIFGYDDTETAIPRIIEFLNSENVTLGVVETSQQSMNLSGDGYDELIVQSGYNAVRTFTMWDYVQWRFAWYDYDGPEEITNCLYRAAYERNCRLIYLKMMQYETDDGAYKYVTDPQEYETLLGDFMDRMNDKGYTMQTLTAARQITIGYPTLMLIAIGAVAAAILLLGLVFSMSTKLTYLLTGLGCLGAAGILYIMPDMGRLILSIGGGIVMPLLAVVAMAVILKKTTGKLSCWIEGVLAVAGVALVSLVGGFFAAAPLSDSAYMLEMELYRGVKVMQLIPLAGFVCYAAKCCLESKARAILDIPKEEKRAAVERVLDTSVKIRHVLLTVAVVIVVAFVASAGRYYLARTGHTEDVSIADLELQLRNFLELHLTARPRTKEFLIGYPSIMLFIWCYRKQSPATDVLAVFFGLGAVIGATSIVNTFLHIRTFFMLSLVRVFTGLATGLAIGLLAVAIAELIYRLLKKRLHHV